MSIKKQISIINNEIKDHAELVAVSKTRSIEDINEAYNQGQKKFGENRVQEIVDKFNKLPKDIEWHMIGHLQKNKVKYISEFISLIHSLDRLSLANEIDKNGKKHDKSIDCLIQIKISKEESKFGLNIDELHSFYNEVKMFKNINIRGLMGMATYTDDKELVNNEFKKMKKLFEKMKSIDSNIKILVTNTGNGKDTFKLTKELEEGLTLYLTETYFELEPQETKEINTQGLETKSNSDYDAVFEVKSVGNDNVSADIILKVKGNSDSNSNSSLNGNLFILTVGAIVFSMLLTEKRKR